MPVKVIVPNKFFNGKRAGVQFKDGVAIFEDEQLGKEIAVRFGYSVEEEKPAAKKPAKKAAPKKPAAKKEAK